MFELPEILFGGICGDVISELHEMYVKECTGVNIRMGTGEFAVKSRHAEHSLD